MVAFLELRGEAANYGPRFSQLCAVLTIRLG